jgi:hypothetical protein
MPYLIAEYRFDPPLTDDQLNRDSAALQPCLQTHGVRRLRTYLAADRTRGFCEFEAADAESVRLAFRSAKVGFKRVYEAVLYGPP